MVTYRYVCSLHFPFFLPFCFEFLSFFLLYCVLSPHPSFPPQCLLSNIPLFFFFLLSFFNIAFCCFHFFLSLLSFLFAVLCFLFYIFRVRLFLLFFSRPFFRVSISLIYFKKVAVSIYISLPKLRINASLFYVQLWWSRLPSLDSEDLHVQLLPVTFPRKSS